MVLSEVRYWDGVCSTGIAYGATICCYTLCGTKRAYARSAEPKEESAGPARKTAKVPGTTLLSLARTNEPRL
eukprot:2119980-Rhodomonas_salina.1